MPSVSPRRVKLWSYADLMGLRTIYWLRQPKSPGDGPEVPRTTMPAVRRALKALGDLDLALWTEAAGPTVAVDRAGKVVIRSRADAMTADGQAILDADEIDLIEPFPALEGPQGPNLQVPRRRLRIVPGKLAGSPHIQETRLETQALSALSTRGLEEGRIYELYPSVQRAAIDDALDLERQLLRNLSVAA